MGDYKETLEHKFWDPRYSTGVVCVIPIRTFSACLTKWQVFGISTVKSRSSSRVMFRAVTVYSVCQ